MNQKQRASECEYDVKSECAQHSSKATSHPFMCTNNTDNGWPTKHLLQSTLQCHVEVGITTWADCIAINQETGWLALVDDVSDCLVVLEPVQSNSFAVRAKSETFQSELQLDAPLSPAPGHLNIGRIRFVGDYIYFKPECGQIWELLIFKFDETTCTIDFVRRLHIDTFDTVDGCRDIAVTPDGKALVLLHQNRIEVWRLMNGSKHFHTVFGLPAFVDSWSLELGVFDDENIVLLDREIIPSKTHHRLIAVNAFAERPQYKSVETTSFDSEPNHGGESAEASTSCGFVFCVSKRYGLFYASNSTLYQSVQSPLSNDKERVRIPIRTMLPQPIAWINKMLFDESYGISGRLLIFYGGPNGEQEVDQMLNVSEFPCFFDKSLTPSHSVIVFSVFEMLFGDDVVQQLRKRRKALLTQMSHEPKPYRLGRENMWFITGKHRKG